MPSAQISQPSIGISQPGIGFSNAGGHVQMGGYIQNQPAINQPMQGIILMQGSLLC